MKLRKELEDLEGQHRKLYLTSVFLLKMAVAGLVFRGILFLDPDTYFLQEILAAATHQILAVLSVNLDLQGILLVGPESSYLITQDCLGWKSVAALTGLTFASSASFLKHLRFVLAGAVVILGLNVVRVVTTVYLSYLDIISFEIIHTVFWKWGLTLIVLLIWFSYFRILGNPDQELGNL